MHQAVPKRADPRILSSLPGTGGDRRGGVRRSRGAGLHRQHSPGTRALHRPGSPPGPDGGRAAGKGSRLLQGTGWVDAHRRLRHGQPRGQRYRRRRHTPRGRGGAGDLDPRGGSGHGDIFLRWGGQQRCLRGVPQPGFGLESSRDLRSGEQPLCRHLPDRGDEPASGSVSPW